MSEYEWWCPRCRVSHPPGRKVCLHCGGRVERERDAGAPAAPRPIGFGAPPLGRPLPPGRPGAPAPTSRSGPAPRPGPPPPIEGDEEEAASAARPLRIGVALTWLVLALLGSLLRFCQEGG